MMLHTKYQGSIYCGFGQGDFSCVPYISLCYLGGPKGGPIVLPQGHNFHKLYRSLLNDATN